MLTTFKRSGSMWAEAESGELLTDDDLVQLVQNLGDTARVHIFIPDSELEELEPDLGALNDAFTMDGDDS